MNSRQPPCAVRLERVTRRFGSVTAVDELSLDLPQGRTVALLGSNGAGKTTTIEITLGLLGADAGVVRLFDVSTADAIAAGRVGAMLQDAGIPPGMKVGELVGFVGSLYPDPMPLGEVLELTGLGDVDRRQVQRLSGGQRQRVRLALALVGRPDLLVLDEPTAALDVDARRAFWAGVRTSVAAGQTVLFATHRLEEAEAIADRVIVISGGRVVADGSPSMVTASASGNGIVRLTSDGVLLETVEQLPAVTRVEVSGGRYTVHTVDPDRTVRAVFDLVPVVRDLEVTRPGLEDVFVALTREEES